MTIPASAIILDARDLHPAFDEDSNPDGVLVRSLNRLQMELMQAALTRYPGLYSTTEDFAMSAIDFDNGNALGSPFWVQDVTQFNNGTEAPVRIIPYEHRFDGNQPYLHGWIVNLTLFLAKPSTIWLNTQTIRVRYATTLPQLTTLASTLVVPVEARSALTYALAEIMAARGTQRKDIMAPSASYFAEKSLQERERWLTDLWLLRSTDSRFIRDVTPE